MPGKNSLFKLYRRSSGDGDDAWRETGEVYQLGDDCGSEPDQRLPIEEFLTLRQIEDGWEYKAEPA